MRAVGLECGLVANPGTPIEQLFPFLDQLDLALVMSVEPGFGGQSFQRQALKKIEKLRSEIERRGLDISLQVDSDWRSTVASTRKTPPTAAAPEPICSSPVRPYSAPLIQPRPSPPCAIDPIRISVARLNR